ncbi:MAG TPA: glycosyltransferase family 4 protein [Gemmatimonadales bacterium]|nr:glycosyltransferase family 4 protein [Gemmatimonadales bacterium]
MIVPGGVAQVPEEGWIPCLHWLIERLARQHEVHVFSLYGARHQTRYPFVGATVHHAGTGLPRYRTLREIMREHRRSPFSVLHAFWVSPPGVIAALAGRLLRRPIVLHVSGNELSAFPDIQYGGMLTRRGRIQVRAGLAGAHRITAASQQLIAALSSRGYAAELVPLGVDLERWPPVRPRPRAQNTPVRLVHVGTLNGIKDQAILIHAARRLVDQIDFRLDIAGGDTLHGALQALVRQLNLEARVQFHGYLDHRRLHRLVSAADILWMSSRHEAGPLVVLEAAVVGVPTVGTAVGHIAEWAPEAAVAVPVGHADRLAEETVALLNDEPRRLSLAHAAQRRALAQDADWTAREFEKIYQDLSASPRRSSTLRSPAAISRR